MKGSKEEFEEEVVQVPEAVAVHLCSLHILPPAPLLPLFWEMNHAQKRRSNKIILRKIWVFIIFQAHSGSVFSTGKKLTVRHSDARNLFIVPYLLWALEDCAGLQYQPGMLCANTPFQFLPSVLEMRRNVISHRVVLLHCLERRQGKRLNLGNQTKRNAHFVVSKSNGQNQNHTEAEHLTTRIQVWRDHWSLREQCREKRSEGNTARFSINQKHLLNYMENSWNTPEPSLRRWYYILRWSWL